jgi:hypothetical protein
MNVQIVIAHSVTSKYPVKRQTISPYAHDPVNAGYMESGAINKPQSKSAHANDNK